MRVYLGMSFTTALMKPQQDDIVVDVWEGGSTLYGWDMKGWCVDRLPLFVDDSFCVKAALGTPMEFDVKIEVEGEESDAAEKIGIRAEELSSIWPLRALKRGDVVYASRNGWCSAYRKLLSSMKANTIFGELKEIDLVNKIVRIAWWEPIHFDLLVNTLPLDYFMRKAGEREFSGSFKGVPFYISLFAIRLKTNEVLIKILGRRKFNSVYVVLVPGKLYGRDDLSFAYVVLPYERLMSLGSFNEKGYSDLKRLLGIKVSEVISVRGYFEKYGILRESPSQGSLSFSNVVFAGRLGKWNELGICDLVKEHFSQV